MKRKAAEKRKAVNLRKKGYSLNEIVEKLGVAKSSVSVWVRNVPLTLKARNRLLTKITKGQLKAAESNRQKTKTQLALYFEKASHELSKQKFSKTSKRIICSLLYWCEGAKDASYGVYFTNSDPDLVKVFLKLFRDGFQLNESKFHVCIHLHDYHNPKRQLQYWSRITNIPKDQFIKPYHKPHTGKRIREGYQGCISIRYSDNNMARELLAVAKVALVNLGK